MKPTPLFSLLSLLFSQAAFSLPLCPRLSAPISIDGPAAFFLAGDSTTATQSSNGGGWGDGFLTTLHNGAFGINYGHDGATTVSFRAGGDWANVLAQVKKYKGGYTPFVTIQFGHNDQKATANITLEEYSANLKQFALDVWAAGGNPILVTPLTRRNFNSTTHLVIRDLADQRSATLAVATSISSYVIDLNEASSDYVNAIGQADSWTYDLDTTEHTHVNSAGSMLFGNMVSGLIDAEIPVSSRFNVKKYTSPNATIEADIKKGIYILPSGFGTLKNSIAPA